MNRFGDIDYSFKQLSPVYGFRTAKIVSLEEALEPIEAQITDLSYFIKIAKENCYFPNEHELTMDQSAAIYIYTMEWGETTLYRILNRELRSENRETLNIWFPYLKLFDTALDHLPTVKESVWRGVSVDIGKNFIKNQMLTWWTVSSCSSSVDVIKTFLRDEENSTLFLIEVINGKKISGYTEFESEDEIILKIGTKFRVKANSLKQSNGSHIVHLIEIHNKDEHNKESLTTDKKNINRNIKTSNQIDVMKWKQNAKIIADRNYDGDKLNQLNYPEKIYIDTKQQSMYIADWGNHRIVKWKLNDNNEQIFAGENGEGNRIDQLNGPTDVVVDQNNKSLIICDWGNRRVVQWSLENTQDKQIIIEDIDCYGIMQNTNEDLFVSDWQKHEVKRWKKGEKGEGTIVAGGNGQGNQLNQLDEPRFIFIDRQETVYISDRNNHRIIKWMKDVKEGIVVAGGYGLGNSLKHLSFPMGLMVNEVGDVYVADWGNDRIMCWSVGSKEGRIIVGRNGEGKKLDQFNRPISISFDVKNNLYVVDSWNHRVNRFKIDKNWQK